VTADYCGEAITERMSEGKVGLTDDKRITEKKVACACHILSN